MTAATLNADDPLVPDLTTLPRKKWSGKRFTLLAIAVLVLSGAVAGGYYFLFANKHDASDTEAADKLADNKLVYVDAPDIFVNINAGQGKSQFLKLAVTLQVKGQLNANDVKANLPRIIDSFQVYLRELRAEDLNGSAGMFLLKEELMRQVNVELAPVRIENVLFKEMLLQ
jgi:flagellar protein FliL